MGMRVPQGPNLGPLLFLIIIHDTVISSSQLNFILFAGDTSTYDSDCNEFKLYNVMNPELVKVCNCIPAIKLALIIDKTVYLLFSGKKKL